MIGEIANLAIWEWFKLRRRWMVWILLLLALLFAQLAVWGGFFSYRNLQETGGEITVPATLQQQQGRVPRTVRCNDLLSGDPSRRPADLDTQVTAGLTAQCRQQATTLPARVVRSYSNFTLPGSGALGQYGAQRARPVVDPDRRGGEDRHEDEAESLHGVERIRDAFWLFEKRDVQGATGGG